MTSQSPEFGGGEPIVGPTGELLIPGANFVAGFDESGDYIVQDEPVVASALTVPTIEDSIEPVAEGQFQLTIERVTGMGEFSYDETEQLVQVREIIANCEDVTDIEIDAEQAEVMATILEDIAIDAVKEITDPNLLERVEDIIHRTNFGIKKILSLGLFGATHTIIGGVTGAAVSFITRREIKRAAMLGGAGGFVGGLFGFLSAKTTVEKITARSWAYKGNGLQRFGALIRNLGSGKGNDVSVWHPFARLVKARQLREEEFLLSSEDIFGNTESVEEGADDETQGENLPNMSVGEARRKLADAHLYSTRLQRRGQSMSEQDEKTYQRLLFRVLIDSGLSEEDAIVAMQSEINFARRRRSTKTWISIGIGVLGAAIGGGYLAALRADHDTVTDAPAAPVPAMGYTAAQVEKVRQHVHELYEQSASTLGTPENIHQTVFEQLDIEVAAENVNSVNSCIERSREIIAQLQLKGHDAGLVHQLEQLNSEFRELTGSDTSLEDVDYAAHSLRAHLAEAILHEHGVVDADIINNAGDIDIHNLAAHVNGFGSNIGTIHEGSGTIIFNADNVTQTAMNSAIEKVFGGGGFVEYRVGEVLAKAGLSDVDLPEGSDMSGALDTLRTSFVESVKNAGTHLADSWSVDDSGQVQVVSELSQTLNAKVQLFLNENCTGHGISVRNAFEQRAEIVRAIKSAANEARDAAEAVAREAAEDSTVSDAVEPPAVPDAADAPPTQNDGFINELFGIKNSENSAVVDAHETAGNVVGEGSESIDLDSDSAASVETNLFDSDTTVADGEIPEVDNPSINEVDIPESVDSDLSVTEHALYSEDSDVTIGGNELDEPEMTAGNTSLTTDEAQVAGGVVEPDIMSESSEAAQAAVPTGVEPVEEPFEMNVPEDGFDHRYSGVHITPEKIEEAEAEAQNLAEAQVGANSGF